MTVIASCSANGNTYAVGPTNSPYNVLPGNATQVVWNPWQAEQVPGAVPFAEATYVLKIWDERGPDSVVRGGYMSPFAGKQFAMYRPATYTPFAGKSTFILPLCHSIPLNLCAIFLFVTSRGGYLVYFNADSGQMGGNVRRAMVPCRHSQNRPLWRLSLPS